MSQVDRKRVLEMMKEILARQGRGTEIDEASNLEEIGFRSLDFAELALRVEGVAGSPLSFDGVAVREIRTTGDVLDFLEAAVAGDA